MHVSGVIPVPTDGSCRIQAFLVQPWLSGPGKCLLKRVRVQGPGHVHICEIALLALKVFTPLFGGPCSLQRKVS